MGQDLGRLSNRKVPHYRRSLGVVFQDFRLLPTKTVFDNVAFALRVLGKSEAFIHDAVPEVLGLVGLGNKENRLPHELSGGEQQRVAIARAVVNKPAILLADEPTGNLDPSTSKEIMDVLTNINTAGTTVLMATHDTAIVNAMQKRVIELRDGKIIRDEAVGSYQTKAHAIVVDDTEPDRADSQPIIVEPLDFDPIPDFDPMSPSSEAVDLSYLKRMTEDPL